MPRLKTFAVLLLIALVLLLPLYEFVDIGEHWPYDGNVVLVVLSALYLVGTCVVCRGLARVGVALRRAWLRRLHRFYAHPPTRFAPHAYASLFLIFCHFRI